MWQFLKTQRTSKRTRQRKRRRKARGTTRPLAFESVEDRILLAVMQLNPIKDNTIYSESENSNALGARMDVGNNNSLFSRRALLAFDVAVEIPAGATINSVTLELHLFNNPSGGTAPIELHPLLADWGEGTSNTGQGRGTDPTTGDATWVHTFCDTDFWTTATAVGHKCSADVCHYRNGRPGRSAGRG